MTATGEDDHFIFTQKLSSGHYFCVYDDADKHAVGLIQPDTDSGETMEYYIPDQGAVGTMGDDILEAMELKMVRYVMTLILAVGSNMRWNMTLIIYMMPLE